MLHAVDLSRLTISIGLSPDSAVQMNKVENNAVVYTPCSLHDEGLRTYNITMPQGMICSDVLPDPGMLCSFCVFSYFSASFDVYNAIPTYSFDAQCNSFDVQCSSCIQLPVCHTQTHLEVKSQTLHDQSCFCVLA